jgi:hypothetical protein
VKFDLRFFATRMRHAGIACVAALAAACGRDTPPDGFTAIPAAGSS